MQCRRTRPRSTGSCAPEPTKTTHLVIQMTKAPHQSASKNCVSYFAQQKLGISFCDVDVAFLHTKITTSCKIFILALLHSKTSLVFGDVGLMSLFFVTCVEPNVWGYLVILSRARAIRQVSSRAHVSLASCSDSFVSFVFFTCFLFELLACLLPVTLFSRSFFRLAIRVCMAS